MSISQQLAKHLRDVHFGGNWTCVNLKTVLADVTCQQATTQVYQLNTIATLVHHMYYYVGVVTRVLQGHPLEGKDELSFIYPPITSEEQWQALLNRIWADVETFASLVEQLPEDIWTQNFNEEKYGTYYRNIMGFIEHTHYHLGQITLIKKVLTNER